MLHPKVSVTEQNMNSLHHYSPMCTCGQLRSQFRYCSLLGYSDILGSHYALWCEQYLSYSIEAVVGVSPYLPLLLTLMVLENMWFLRE